METITVETGRPYDITVGEGILQRAREFIPAGASTKILIVTDSEVDKLWSRGVMTSLVASGAEVSKYVITIGAKSKSAEAMLDLLNLFARHRLSKNDYVISLGGGVICDLVGFACSLYLGGIPYVLIPTTLRSAVDSCVGGKALLDLTQGNGLLSVASLPSAVICDTAVFRTLPCKVCADGYAEMIKCALIGNCNLFERMLDKPYENIVRNLTDCVTLKSEISASAKEKGLLDYGHTFEAAIERLGEGSLTYGDSLAFGLMLAARLAKRLELCDIVEETEALLVRYGFETDCPFGAVELYHAMIDGLPARKKYITLVLPEKIGEGVLRETSFHELHQYLSQIV